MTGHRPEREPERGHDLAPFLRLYWRDREGGSVRSLREYVHLFPDLEEEIASEYLALARIESNQPTDLESPEPREDELPDTTVESGSPRSTMPAITPRQGRTSPPRPKGPERIGPCYETALDLAEDLAHERTLRPIPARPLHPLLRLGRWARRHPARAGLLAVVLFAATPLVSALLAFMVATASEREAGRELLLARTIETHLGRGFFELGEGDDEIAGREFASVLALDPDNPEATAGRALALLEADRASDALIQLDLARDPAALSRVRIEVLTAMGRSAEADAIRGSLLRPRDPEHAFVAGLVEMSRAHDGDARGFERAVEHFTTAVQGWPGRPRPSWHLQWLHAIGHAGTEAERDRAASVTLGLWPDDPEVWRWASLALVSQDPERAVALCERFLGLHPNDPTMRSRLAYALAHGGHLDRAEVIARDLVRESPGFGVPLEILGHVFHLRKDWRTALEFYERAYAIDGASPVTNQRIAVLLMELDERANAPRAERLLLEADGIEPDATIRVHLARCCLMQDRPSDAAAWYEKAAALEPDDPEVWISLFEVCSESGDYERALHAARQAYVHAAGDPRWPINEWLAETHANLAAARRLDAVLAGEARPQSIGEFTRLLRVAEPRGPEAVVALWQTANRSGSLTPEERGVLGPAVARAAGRACAHGKRRPGAWLDPVLSILRDEFRAARGLTAMERTKALESLLSPDDFGALLDPTFYGDDEEARRISMQRFFADVRRSVIRG